MIHFKPFKFGQAEWITISVLILLTILVVSISTIPGIADWYERIAKTWTDWAIRYGYLGVFLAALLGNLTIIIIFPYTVVVFFLATSGLNPLWLGILTGTGAVLGELSGYIIGRWGSRKFQAAKPETYEALKTITIARPKFVHWLLYWFSTLPLPDDVLFIPLGMLRYNLWKLIWPAWLGKVTAGLIIAYAGSGLQTVLNGQPATSPWSIASELGSLFILTLSMYALFKLDWNQMMHRLLDSHPSTRRKQETTI